jgi:hypothetical protein
VGTWRDPDLGRPIAAPLERCAELLGFDLVTVRHLAASVEPYVRADGTKIWSLMQLERQMRPEAWWLVWARAARLLRVCCTKRLERRVHPPM